MSTTQQPSRPGTAPDPGTRWQEAEAGTLMETLSMTVLERGAQRTVVRMPVAGALQVLGILHGGASAALVETAASVAAREAAPQGRAPVGAELSVSHLRPVRQGHLRATAVPVHLGRRSALYRVEVVDDQDRLCATGQLRSLFVQV